MTGRRLASAVAGCVGVLVNLARPGGMQQRVAIARAVAYEPQVLLMHEPFAAVDAQTRADLEDPLLGLWRRLGITTVLVTHDIDEAVYLAQRVRTATRSSRAPCPASRSCAPMSTVTYVRPRPSE